MKIRNNYIKEILSITGMVIVLCIQGCKRAVDVPAPTTSLVGETVFVDNKTATAVLTGLYSNMHYNGGFADGARGISIFMATAADEMKNYFVGVAATQFYANDLASNPGTYFWPDFYKYIYVANTALEGLENSQSVNPKVKQQLTGEARFMRAFLNFYAVNFYGDVPLVVSTDYKINNVIKRSRQSDIYKAVISDLITAQSLLTDNYMDAGNLSTAERIRPNKAAATALLARAYLYTGDWKNAEIQATAVINNSNYELLTKMDDVFLKNSREAIWQLAAADVNVTNTLDAIAFILKAAPGITYHATISDYLLNAFETGDKRRTTWINSYTAGANTYYYPYKYRNNVRNSAVTEYQMVLRIGEQYLIRAEARAQQEKATALDDLNAVRLRAGLLKYTGSVAKEDLLKAVQHERQVELFTEWGHRWLDLKRTGKLNGLMGGPTGITKAKGGNWDANDTILPLPLSETQINRNLIQNLGYN